MGINEVKDLVYQSVLARLHREIPLNQYSSPVLGNEINMEPWAIIYLIDEINKRLGIYFDVSNIIENPMFSLNDIVTSIHLQLSK